MRLVPDPDQQPQFYDGVTTKRLVAWVIDMVAVAVVCLMISVMTVFIGFFFWPFLMLIVGFFYRLMTLTSGSATWGMQFTGIEFRTAKGDMFDAQTALFHTLGYTVSMAIPPLQVISIIMMLTSPRGQGLSDSILGTVALNKSTIA